MITPTFPSIASSHRRADLITHVVGLVLIVAAGGLLIARSANLLDFRLVIAVIVYVACAMASNLASYAYHFPLAQSPQTFAAHRPRGYLPQHYGDIHAVLRSGIHAVDDDSALGLVGISGVSNLEKDHRQGCAGALVNCLLSCAWRYWSKCFTRSSRCAVGISLANHCWGRQFRYRHSFLHASINALSICGLAYLGEHWWHIDVREHLDRVVSTCSLGDGQRGGIAYGPQGKA